jgi:hypothetical protein
MQNNDIQFELMGANNSFCKQMGAHEINWELMGANGNYLKLMGA